ncbi:BTB/POZ protein [Rhizophagus clarus]|uniref:BTB/POZ protein n=1 Tax=Rhizophagus clarus TaxID=94130 RepID=A0A8H3QW26_9GLOM|nr:BTB/POZ protein [Rhizophagus clarus]
MSSELFSNLLSQNYIELLDDNEYYDVTIEVGEDPNVKIFRAHKNILCCRSPFLQQTLASNKKSDNDDLSHIKLPNISPEIFQIVLRYIYGGVLSLNRKDTSDILNILVVADELHLQELVNYLQKYLIENNSEWLEQHYELIHRTSYQSKSLLEFQEFCTNLMAESPEKIFKSFDFTSLPEKSLIPLIKRDDLQMKEIEIWEYVLKWGLVQNPTLDSDPKTWSNDDFKTMKNTLQHCLPLIRFFSLTSKELAQKVRPYKKLLNKQLYQDLIDSYIDPDNVSTDNILLPRNIRMDKIIDSQIGDLVKGEEEIIGGYNPLKWESDGGWVNTKDSFIFSFKNKNVKDAIISNVENSCFAFNNYFTQGPYFGNDISIYSSTDELTDYDKIFYKKLHYERKIRESEDYFSIENYEVFQIIKR